MLLYTVVTDGAKAVVGSQNGLVGLLRKNDISCVALHCTIHHSLYRIEQIAR